MNLSDFASALRRNWVVAVSGVLVGLLGSFAILTTSDVVYRSTSEIFLTTPGWGGPTTLGNLDSSPFQGDEFSRQRAQTYVRVVEGDDFSQRVSDRMQGAVDAAEIAAHLSVRVVPDTVLLELTAGSGDPVTARDIAVAAGEQITEDISALETPAGLTLSTVQPVTVGTAEVPSEPSSPHTALTLICGVTLGVLAGATAVVVRERLRHTVDDPRTVADLVGAPVLGVAPSASDPDADARFDALRYEMQFRGARLDSGVILVTSTRHGDGRTSVVSGLARAYARAGRSVVTVDADFRQKTAVGDTLGLSNAVAGDVDAARIVRTRDGMDHVATGAHPQEPARVLENPRFAEVLADLAGRYDIVLVDSPALADVDDARTVARIADATIVVVAAGRTSPDALARAVSELDGVGVRAAGAVLTHLAPDRSRSGYTAPTHDQPSPTTAQTGTVNR